MGEPGGDVAADGAHVAYLVATDAVEQVAPGRDAGAERAVGVGVADIGAER